MSSKPQTRKRRPATTPEGREDQLISLAYDLVEKRLINGTASATETTFLVKAGSRRDRLEQQKIQQENLLLSAKIEQIGSMQRQEELYAEALRAMRAYAGQKLEEDDDDY